MARKRDQDTRRQQLIDAFIGETDMHGIGIRRGMDGDRCDPQLLACSLNAERDFTAIGDQDFIEHRAIAYSIIMSGSPYSTG